MDQGWAVAGAYGLVGVGAAVLSLALTPLALSVARRRGWLDHPGGHKSQPEAVPYFGGAAIVVSFALVVGGGAVTILTAKGAAELGVVLACGLALALVGLVDDLRSLGPAVRVLSEAIAGGIVFASGVAARPFDIPLLDGLTTILWVIAITNCINLLDNMDGLAGGTAAICAASFFMLAALNGQVLVATLAIALCGCALGFLRHNAHPARIYMGDSGSMFLGFMLAVIGIKLRPDAPQPLALFVPVLVLAVPLLDTALVIVTRVLHGMNPLLGGRDHISHRLVFLGLPIRLSVSIIYAFAASSGWLALVLNWTSTLAGWLLVAWFLTAATSVGVGLARVPVYDSEARKAASVRLLAARRAKRSAEPVVRRVRSSGA